MNTNSLKNFFYKRYINKQDYYFLLNFCKDNSLDFMDFIKDDFTSCVNMFSVSLTEKDEDVAKKIWKDSYKKEINNELLYLALKNNFGRTIVKEKSQELLSSLIEQKKIRELKNFISENPNSISNINYFISKSYRLFDLNEFKYFEKIGVDLDFSSFKRLNSDDIFKHPEKFLEYVSEKTKSYNTSDKNQYYIDLFNYFNSYYFSSSKEHDFYLADRFELILNIPQVKLNLSKLFGNGSYYDNYIENKLTNKEKLYYINDQNKDISIYKNKINLFLNKQISEATEDEINFKISNDSFFDIFNIFNLEFSYDNKCKVILSNLEKINGQIEFIFSKYNSEITDKYSSRYRSLSDLFKNKIFDNDFLLFSLNALFHKHKNVFKNGDIFKTLFMEKTEQEKIDLAKNIFFKNENLYLQLEKTIEFSKSERQKINQAIIFSSIKNDKQEKTKKLKI